MDKNYTNAVKRSYNGGRSRLASALDFLFFNLIRLLAVYLLLKRPISEPILRLFLSITITIILSIISKLVSDSRYRKHEARLRRDTAKKLIQRKLLCMTARELRTKAESALGTDCIIIQTASEADVDAVYEAMRSISEAGLSQVCLVSVSGFTADAIKLCERCFCGVIDAKAITDIPGFVDISDISDGEIDREITLEYEKPVKAKPGFKNALMPDMVKKYVMLGAILFALSFIVRFSIYMRLTASLAFCAAGACMVLNEYSVRKKMKR